MFAKLIPYIFLGVAIVILVAGIILFSYILILGAILGLILFAIQWLKDKLFPSKSIAQTGRTRRGRTFEHKK